MEPPPPVTKTVLPLTQLWIWVVSKVIWSLPNTSSKETSLMWSGLVGSVNSVKSGILLILTFSLAKCDIISFNCFLSNLEIAITTSLTPYFSINSWELFKGPTTGLPKYFLPIFSLSESPKQTTLLLKSTLLCISSKAILPAEPAPIIIVGTAPFLEDE